MFFMRFLAQLSAKNICDAFCKVNEILRYFDTMKCHFLSFQQLLFVEVSRFLIFPTCHVFLYFPVVAYGRNNIEQISPFEMYFIPMFVINRCVELYFRLSKALLQLCVMTENY